MIVIKQAISAQLASVVFGKPVASMLNPSKVTLFQGDIGCS